MSARRTEPVIECALFDTPLGRCGIAWGPDGIVGIQLPDTDDAETRQRMRDRFGAVDDARPHATCSARSTPCARCWVDVDPTCHRSRST